MLLNRNDAKSPTRAYISFIISSLHEVVKKFLVYNATSSSSVLVKHLFTVVERDVLEWTTKIFYGRLSLLSE